MPFLAFNQTLNLTLIFKMILRKHIINIFSFYQALNLKKSAQGHKNRHIKTGLKI